MLWSTTLYEGVPVFLFFPLFLSLTGEDRLGWEGWEDKQ